MITKKGFTLIELLIVIVVIGILMSLGLLLNRNNISTLQSKATIEEVTGFFDTMFLQVQASNHIYNNDGEDTTYDKLSINVTKDSVINYQYSLGDSSILEGDVGGNFLIKNIFSSEDAELNNIIISYSPFKIDCDLEDNDEIFFVIQSKGVEDACTKIDKNYCKIQTINCCEVSSSYSCPE